MIRVDAWSLARARDEADAVFAVYDAVFGDVPDVADWRLTTYERHVNRRGFRLVAARDDDTLVGFAYGYVGERGQYWSDRVAAALPPDVVADWVGGHFEFVELGVLPSHRRQGLGRRLHDALMDGAPGERALLGTADDPHDPAVRLYRSCGWRKLGNLDADVQIMGRRVRVDRVDA